MTQKKRLISSEEFAEALMLHTNKIQVENRRYIGCRCELRGASQCDVRCDSKRQRYSTVSIRDWLVKSSDGRIMLPIIRWKRKKSYHRPWTRDHLYQLFSLLLVLALVLFYACAFMLGFSSDGKVISLQSFSKRLQKQLLRLHSNSSLQISPASSLSTVSHVNCCRKPLCSFFLMLNWFDLLLYCMLSVSIRKSRTARASEEEYPESPCFCVTRKNSLSLIESFDSKLQRFAFYVRLSVPL